MTTKERIIFFAKQLPKSASVRDIAAKAGCNVAAISYHFGSKEGLRAAIDSPSPTLVPRGVALTEEERKKICGLVDEEIHNLKEHCSGSDQASDKFKRDMGLLNSVKTKLLS